MQDRTKPGTETPPSLSPGLGNVLFDVWLVSRATHALIDDALKSAGLDADEYAVYSLLASGQPVTPTELSHWMAAPPTTVSSYIKRFEKRGHMARVSNPEDGRSYRVKLTPEGKRAHTKASKLFGPLLAEVEQDLGGAADKVHRQMLELHRTISQLRD